MTASTKENNDWDDRATAAAITSARKVVNNSTPFMNTPVGRLSDAQWGWIVTGAIFGWVQTRVEQAIAEGLDQEQAVRLTGLSPSPCDVACASNRKLAIVSWQLITKAEIARDQGPGKILRKSKDWTKEGDDIAHVPPPLSSRGS